jgi:hypothetical protein
MPGRLLVEHYDSLLKSRVPNRLDEVRPGTQITASGTLTNVRYLNPRGGRIHAIITDDEGQSALVDFPPGVVALIRPLLAPGTRVTIAGLVQLSSINLPATISGYNARLVDES